MCSQIGFACIGKRERFDGAGCVQIRMIEGQMGMLRAYIIPSSSGGQGNQQDARGI